MPLAGKAKTKLVDGVRVNTRDNSVASPSTYGQGQQAKIKGLTVGDVYSPERQAQDVSKAARIEDLKKKNAWEHSYARKEGKTYTPTVLTDENIRTGAIPQIKNEAQNLLGQPQGTAQNPGDTPQDGQQNTEEPANEYDQLYQGLMGTSPAADPFYDTELKLLEDMQKTSDARTQASLQALTSTYNARRAEQRAAVGAGKGAAQTLLMSGGGYRSGSGSRVISGIERAGIREIAALDAQEQSLKADALAAQTESDYKVLGEKLNLLKEKRKEKLEIVGKMWDEKVKQDEVEAKAAAEKAKSINDVVKAAAENSAPPDVLKAIGQAENETEAWIAAGNYAIKSGSLEETAFNQARAAGYSGSLIDFHRQWEAAGRKPESPGDGVTPGYNGDFAATIGLASNNMGSVYAQKALKDQLESSIAEGDWSSAATGIEQATAAGLTGENRTKFENAATDQSVLADMHSAIKAYADAGGDTNIFKGTADNIGKRIGVLANDPKYASLAVQLDRAFQQYRQNMTGAAFGAKESSEYARVLPQKSNSLDLNLSTIEGALNYTDSYVRANVKNKTGQGGVEILDRAKGGDIAMSIADKDKAAQAKVIEYMAQSSENQAAADAIRAAAPSISAEELLQQLGLSLQ